MTSSRLLDTYLVTETGATRITVYFMLLTFGVRRCNNVGPHELRRLKCEAVDAPLFALS